MMLQSETITGIQKYMIEFDLKRKEVQAKFESMSIEDKDEGLTMLVGLFQRCASYHDQLKLFALKAQPLLKICLGDIQNFKNQRDKAEFKQFTGHLIEFLNKIICDTRYIIEMPGELRPLHFHVDYFGQLLEQTEGMFASIA